MVEVPMPEQYGFDMGTDTGFDFGGQQGVSFSQPESAHSREERERRRRNEEESAARRKREREQRQREESANRERQRQQDESRSSVPALCPMGKRLGRPGRALHGDKGTDSEGVGGQNEGLPSRFAERKHF